MATDKPRFQEIKFNGQGKSFVTYYGCRHYLDEFIICKYLHNGEQLCGMKGRSAFDALGIIINEQGDAAKVVHIR